MNIKVQTTQFIYRRIDIGNYFFLLLLLLPCLLKLLHFLSPGFLLSAVFLCYTGFFQFFGNSLSGKSNLLHKSSAVLLCHRGTGTGNICNLFFLSLLSLFQ